MVRVKSPATPAQLRSFRRALLAWYDRHRRDLPWRRDRDPYRVWVSEIMLQQTRVAAVLDHYARFLERFPTLQSLAAARQASVLAIWSGLGYYHRARRMHQAAKVIARERDGRFPHTADEWLELPGIGRYTAAAIASIAFDEPVAVVDGNVERILQRLLGNESGRVRVSPTEERTLRQAQGRLWGTTPRSTPPRTAKTKPSELRIEGTQESAQGRETAWRQAEALLDRKRPGDFNQAMMELGATICMPRATQCLRCPLNTFCKSRSTTALHAHAARKRKTVSYAFTLQNSSVLLVRRSQNSSLMAGMWELPALDPKLVNGDRPLLRVRHSITNTDYRVAVYAIPPDPLAHSATEVRWATRRQWEQLALTGLTRKILRQLDL